MFAFQFMVYLILIFCNPLMRLGQLALNIFIYVRCIPLCLEIQTSKT